MHGLALVQKLSETSLVWLWTSPGQNQELDYGRNFISFIHVRNLTSNITK